MTRCRGCGAEVEWRKHVRTRRPAPLDVEPNSEGPCILVGDEEYEVLKRGQEYSGERFTNHFQTCPDREQFKGGR